MMRAFAWVVAIGSGLLGLLFFPLWLLTIAAVLVAVLHKPESQSRHRGRYNRYRRNRRRRF